ncbi:MAG TPA: NAD(P)-dependent oxidoreductase [Myxococcota bacterium]|nr:NAD(P)-dependent oxidoreductase [Myxococcota bacterium]
MRIAVTGASGRIGRVLLPELIGAGHEVVGLARSESSADLVRGAGARVVRGDLLDTSSLNGFIDGADRVLHLAGGVRGAGRTTPDLLNRVATENLAGVVGETPVVLASSCAVYGDRSNLWVEEDFEPSPNTRYGTSKVAAEGIARERGWTIARIAAIYGAGFPFAMVERMRAGKAWLPGEGRNHVPTMHVDDCVRALVLLAEAEPGLIVHLADRSQPTLREFYDCVHQRVGGTPMRFWSTYVPSYVQLWAARNNERLQSRIDQKPRFTPDSLRLFTNSVRLRTRVLEGLGFEWLHAEHEAGIAATWTP